MREDGAKTTNETFSDIIKLHGAELEPVDVVIGGSPCQDLSIAGVRKGLAGERSGLFMEQIRIIKELRDADISRGRTGQFIRPRFAVWENVPGAFSSNKGKDFQQVLTEFARIAEPEAPAVPLPEKGRWPGFGVFVGSKWSIAWRVLDAQYWGVPQRRKRIALVMDFASERAGEILTECESVSGHLEQGRAEREGVAADAQGSTYPAVARSLTARYDGSPCIDRGPDVVVQGAFNPWDSQSARVYSDSGVWHSLNANENGGQSRGAVFCIQGNCIDRVDTAGCDGKGWTENVSYTLNTIDRPAVAFAQNQRNEVRDLNDVAGCLPAESGMKQQTYICQSAGFSMGNSAKARSIGWLEEMAPTLRGGEGGNQKPRVYDARGNGDGNIVPTITGDHENRVTDYTALCVGNGQLNQVSMSEQANPLDTMHDQQAVIQNSIVRRLTPVECERLQGFPDGWTDIGDWVDDKGKRRKAADSPRYRALGNSIALPPWKWVLKRICAEYTRDATMGSLFDGIGGFTLIWCQLNGGIKSVPWVSEIEPFCIAVTKRRFGDGVTKGDWKEFV